MLAPTHQNFGFTFGLTTLILLQISGIQPINLIHTFIFFALVLLGSLLPDLDTPNSKLGRKLWPISFILRLFFKHRTATHSILFVGILAVIGFTLLYPLTNSLLISSALAIGTSSHIIGDWLTSRGVPLLYPFIRKRYRSPLTFKTGSFTETVVSGMLVFVNITLFLFILLV